MDFINLFLFLNKICEKEDPKPKQQLILKAEVLDRLQLKVTETMSYVERKFNIWRQRGGKGSFPFPEINLKKAKHLGHIDIA